MEVKLRVQSSTLILFSDPFFSPGDQIEIDDDHIKVNGVVFNKPFVEKPVNAENHNIRIYYPSSAGGGLQKLFRKV